MTSDDATPPRRTSTATLLSAVVLGPPVLVLLVVLPVFRAIQGVGVPAGSLEGVDMTPFAIRDEVVFWGSGLLLTLLVLAVARRGSTRRSRVALSLAGLAATLASLVMFLALTFAG